MAGRVLKIDVLIDENGNGRRALSELDSGVKKIETSAQQSAPALSDFDKKIAGYTQRVGELGGSLGEMGGAAELSAVEVAGLSTGVGLLLTVAGAAGATIYALGNYIKDSTEYYIEQSGVLNVNKESIDGLKASWEALQFAIGEVVVGGQGDFRGWIDAATAGLVLLGAELGADIQMLKEVAQLAKDVKDLSGGGNLDLSPPGIDTSERNPDGSLTPYGRMMEEKRKQPKGDFQFGNLNGDPYSGAEAERITNEEITRQHREQLDLERQQKQEAAEHLKLLNERARLENEAALAIERSQEAYEREITAAEQLNEKTRTRLDLQLRDSLLKDTLSKSDYDQNAINEDYTRKTAAVDPRADNAAQLLRSYEAEKQLALIQLRQASEGFSQGIADDLNHFRAEYADVVGAMPTQFQQVIPPVLAASGALRDGVSGDLGVVRDDVGATGQSFLLLGGNVNATFRQVADGLKAADDAYKKAGFVLMPNLDVSRLRGQQTGGLLYGLGGVVEPQYFALGGGPAGVDTVPAYLRPGEGVLSRTGMAALDRLNSGMGPAAASRGATIEKGAVTIDARGAQFTDQRSLDQLADKVSQRLTILAQRNGAYS